MEEKLGSGRPGNKLGANISALVDKSLGNYSGPFDVFRELIQNADDAEAKNVEIRFQTEKSGEHCDTSEGDNAYMWIIRDNGRGLDDPQWKRLYTIGDGNHEQAKVGTFGVGFYTVLGVCDSPRVRSNGRSLQIQRFEDRELRWMPLEPCESDGWTSVELVLRNGVRKRLPHLPDIARFLISSITFLENVKSITVFLADREILYIEKTLQLGSSIEVPVIRGESGIMTIESIRVVEQFVSVHAKDKAFFAEQKILPNETTADVEGFAPSPEIPNRTTTSQPSESSFKAAYFLYTARIKSHLQKEMEEEVKSTMKGLLSGFSCEAVYFDAKQRDHVENSSLRHLFDGSDGILPQKNRNGRIFIGQSTKESTGIGLHIASKHIVPDVVRSSVRLGNSQVDKWNESLLNIAGHLARAIYEQEMKIAGSKIAEVEKLGLYTMQQFAFKQNPTCGTSLHLKSGFFSTPEQSVLSNHGISHVSLVRRYNKGLHSILKKMPHLHAQVPAEQWDPTDERTIIKRCGSQDIIEEFASYHLSEADMENFFGWWGNNKGRLGASDKKEKEFFNELCDRGHLSCETCGVIELQRIKQYTQLTHDKDLLPSETIYIRQPQVYAHYLRDLFGWEPLDPLEWLGFVCKHDDADPEKAFDSRILTILSGSLSTSVTGSQEWEQAKSHLASFACISTNCGFRKPGDSYFGIAGIWDDIPVVNDHTLNNRVYELLGVRSRLEWDGLLKRLEESTNYTNDRFLPYLADMVVKGDLSEQRLGQLRRKKVFDSEEHGKLTAVALHRPDGLGVRLREHGLPILSLQGTDGIRTDFLNKLGFRVYPPLEEVDKWLASRDKTLADLAEKCLSDNGEEYYEEAKQPDVAMIPTKSGSLVHLNEVVSCPVWEEMGFHMISHSLTKYADILGVKDTPPPDILIERLETKAPSNIGSAQKWIKQLSQNTIKFEWEHVRKLEEVRFVPFETYPIQPNLPPTTHQCLKDCFVMSSLPQHKRHLARLLPFIELDDGGDDSPITRIIKREPPKASDIATAIVACPRRFLELTPDDRYDCLQDIAKEFDTFSGELQMALRKSPILLWRHMSDGPYGEEPKEACEILIGGDRENLRDFCPSVPVAPDGLKALYEKLGSKSLDSCVTYEVRATDEEPTSSPSLKPTDVIQCVNTLKKKEPELEFPDDIHELAVKTCKTLKLHKVLECPLGAFAAKPREVTAGLSKDPITLYIVKDVDKQAMYADTATALCRKLFTTYSPRDVLAIQLLLMNKESRIGDETNPPAALAPCGISKDEHDSSNLDPHGLGHQDRRWEIPRAPSSTRPTFLSRLLSPKKRKASMVYPKIDPLESAARAISSATQTADPSRESQKRFRELLTRSDFKRKDVYRGQIDTELDPDVCFDMYDIKFFKAKKSHYPEQLGEVVEEFARRVVVPLAKVFKKDCATFRIFWKNSDPGLMAFYHKRDHIYLNLAHYHERHYQKGDEKTIIMDWYLIFAHELAHNESSQHDELHEKTFVGLCMKHTDALCKRFPCISDVMTL